MPIKHWLKSSLEDYARELLLSADSKLPAYFEPSAIAGLVADHRKGGRDFSRKIWALMWLEQWLRSVPNRD